MDDIGKLGAEKEGPEMIQAHGETTNPRLEISFLLNNFYLILVMLFMRISLVVHKDNMFLLMISLILVTCLLIITRAT